MKNILLVSDTPVAGTVARFAQAFNDLDGYEAVPFIMRNYKDSAFDLPMGAMGTFENWAQLLGSYAAKADHIIFHNVASEITIDVVKAWVRPGASLNYHLHSPPFEPPLYTFDVITRGGFDNHFCVAQGHARFCVGATSIANIIADVRLFPEVRRRSAVLVGHLRTTSARWSCKVPNGYIDALKASLADTAIDVFSIERLFGAGTVPHQTFIQALQGFDFVVDDICSGMFHQLSLEGLKSGCIVFSAADDFALDCFCEAASCPRPPLDIVSDPSEVSDRMRAYARKPDLLHKRQRENLEFSKAYLGSRRLSNLFVRRFMAVTEGSSEVAQGPLSMA